MFHSIFPEFIRDGWARTNEAHIACQYIPELRQLVQDPFSKKPAQLCYPWIVGNLEENSVPLVEMLKRFLAALRVRNHRPAFVADERRPLLSQSHRDAASRCLRIDLDVK